MDLKEHLFEMKRRIRENPETYMTIDEVAEHFDVHPSFVAAWFSRTPRAPVYPMLQELAKMVGYSDKETTALNDAWFQWRFSRGASAHLADVLFDHIDTLSPKVRRNLMDRLTAAEAGNVKSVKGWGG